MKSFPKLKLYSFLLVISNFYEDKFAFERLSLSSSFDFYFSVFYVDILTFSFLLLCFSFSFLLSLALFCSIVLKEGGRRMKRSGKK